MSRLWWWRLATDRYSYLYWHALPRGHVRLRGGDALYDDRWSGEIARIA